MSATNTDLLRKLSRRWVSQIGSGGVADAVATTIPLSSTTNLPTDTAVTLVIDRVDANGIATPTSEETIVGVVSGTNIVNAVRGVEGTAQAHSAGAVVEVLVTADGYNDIIDHLLVEHGQDGKHTKVNGNTVTAGTDTVALLTASQTLTNKTLTSPVINTPTLVLPDSSPTADGSIGFDRTNEELQIGDGTNSQFINVGAWKTWTPSFTNLTKGSATIIALYCQIGKTVHFKLSVKFAADTSVGTEPKFSLPVTAANIGTAGSNPFGNILCLDSGTGHHSGVVIFYNTTTAGAQYFVVSGSTINKGAVSASAPFTWTTNDELNCSGTYEAA